MRNKDCPARHPAEERGENMEREKDKEQKNRLDTKNTRLRVLSGIVLAILLFGTCILGAAIAALAVWTVIRCRRYNKKKAK